jgi:Transglycosylase
MTAPLGRRARRVLAAAACALLLGWGALLLARPWLEQRVRERLDRGAQRLGLTAAVGDVRLGPGATLALRDVVLERPERLRVRVPAVDVRPRLSAWGLVGRAATVSLSRVVLDLPVGVRIEVVPSTWGVEAGWRRRRLWREGPGETPDLVFSEESGGRRHVARATHARLSELVRVLIRGCPAAELGTLDGEVREVEDPPGTVRVDLEGRVRELAVASLAVTAGRPCASTPLGLPVDAEARARAALWRGAGTLRVDPFRLAASGAEVTGRLAAFGGLASPRIDLDLSVARLELARVLAASGLDLPAADVGSAALRLHVAGPLLDPASLVVTQKLDFTPPRRPLPEIERLRGPFVYQPTARGEAVAPILVGPESPDFIPLAEVPPLFVRAVLLAEDANFYGHPGIDLAELPAAIGEDLARGTYVRGASTIPQQLAKNLFLSKRKTLGRKLEEASLALLLDSALGKERELEIYLNIAQWGPGLYGLCPAARRYFGKPVSALTPRETVFLVCLIPGPIKYQQSFATGVPTPFFEGLMNTLLGKLESVGALSEEEYQAALAQPLDLRPRAVGVEHPYISPPRGGKASVRDRHSMASVVTVARHPAPPLVGSDHDAQVRHVGCLDGPALLFQRGAGRAEGVLLACDLGRSPHRR